MKYISATNIDRRFGVGRMRGNRFIEVHLGTDNYAGVTTFDGLVTYKRLS